jgi:hypothetical protein
LVHAAEAVSVADSPTARPLTTIAVTALFFIRLQRNQKSLNFAAA